MKVSMRCTNLKKKSKLSFDDNTRRIKAMMTDMYGNCSIPIYIDER